MTERLRPGLGLRFLALALAVPAKVDATTIEDYQDHLNPGFTKRRRQDTRFILVHSTECGLESALRTLSRGKVRRGRRVTLGGHAHYLLGRQGTIYRILDLKYRADHAGISMWRGLENLSDHSLGIELEGFHDAPFTTAQYRSLGWLLRVLRKRFGIASRDVSSTIGSPTRRRTGSSPGTGEAGSVTPVAGTSTGAGRASATSTPWIRMWLRVAWA